MTAHTDTRRYYLDVLLLTPEGRPNTVNRPSYGPFEDRQIAEQTMSALAARADVSSVTLREYNPKGTHHADA